MKSEATISLKEPKVSSFGGDLEEAAFHLHLTGIVQGVGFRPMVANFANQNNLKGFVCNAADGLHIEFNATKAEAKIIVEKLLGQAPPLAKIQSIELSTADFIQYTDFNIIESDSLVKSNLPLTPDFALCEDCRKELHDKNNRRYNFPFITCTNCGPRYSIIEKIPYDRSNTTIQYFDMCDECNKEYFDIANRRYYSQTNSCHHCGDELSLYAGQELLFYNNPSEIISTILCKLSEGKIIAVKGIGGYLLLCDATNKEAVQLLRKRKHRPTKPFAVMFTSVEQASEYVYMNDASKRLLQSEVSPVVLLKTKPNTSIAVDNIAPKLESLGVLIPYAPLFEMILSEFGKPVIATSGNVSNSPVIYNDNQALEYLSEIAGYIVTHNRRILTPQDDSVVRLTSLSKQKIIIRRSRGLAPSFFGYQQQSNETVLATGALMKSSFTLTCNQNIYVSQYLGGTDSYESQLSYRKTLKHLLYVFNALPQVIVTDKHPQYFSNELAKELAIKYNTDVIEVQHHKAHFAAVLAENNLLKTEEHVLGVIWDGIGLGDDEQIWGAEFFTYAENRMVRCFHFEYFPMLLGDKMAKEPRLSALATCNNILNAEEILKPKFSDTEWSLYQSMLQQNDLLQCSSMGRIFDAVACLLNICDKQSYEGEAALLLETMAQKYFDKNSYDFEESYFADTTEDNCIPTSDLFRGIINDIHERKAVGFIAAKFHYSLAMIAGKIADVMQCKKIAFGGGVFQNALLVDLMQYHLSAKYELFFHKELSPNDENISFGQFVYADNNIDAVGLFNRINVVQECDANEAK